MKGFYCRLVIACTVFVSVFLTGLGIVLGQFFPLFADHIDLDVQRKYWAFLIVTLLSHLFCLLFIASE